ncbi:uncharacterized protein LOC134740890 [Cydia strobilella]|uniref:uncharacterized protein LOC134740890 n=1 Tax=Cydia strobilella TaxID=1100964 RepID=UPI0030048BEA
MSPVACSLLSFVALLAVSKAVVTPVEEHGPCAKFIMDITSANRDSYNGIDEVKFQFEANKDEVLHSVRNTCKQLGSEVAKQIVEACDEDYIYLTKPILAPLGAEILSPVYATCEGVPDCGHSHLRHTSVRSRPRDDSAGWDWDTFIEWTLTDSHVKSCSDRLLKLRDRIPTNRWEEPEMRPEWRRNLREGMAKHELWLDHLNQKRIRRAAGPPQESRHICDRCGKKCRSGISLSIQSPQSM